MIIDIMHFSGSIPFVAVERSIRFGELAAARKVHPQRPPWSALFAKAFALVARDFDVLRQAYFQFPIPYLYEYAESTVSIAHEISMDGEASILPVRIHSPDAAPLAAIGYKIAEMHDAELWRRGFYRTLAAVGYLPFFLRRPIWWIALNLPRLRQRCFGTFAVTSVGAFGADSVIARAPVTSLLAYGRLRDDGTLSVRLLFDHRVYDGATAARVLVRLEEILRERIQEELKAGVSAPAA